MYTQCSKCETVFKLSAQVLRAAGGQVRCGKCGDVFNALARLAEDSDAFETGESALDLETRADSILESVVAPPEPHTLPQDEEDFGPPGVEIAHLQFIDVGDEDPADAPVDRSMEFTLPPGELDRIFVESKKRASRPTPRDTDANTRVTVSKGANAGSDADASADGDTSAHRTPAQPSSALPFGTLQAPRLQVPPAAASPPMPPSDLPLPPHPESAIPVDRRVRDGVSGFEVSEEVRREMLEGMEEDAQAVRAARMVERTDFESPRSERTRRTDRRPFALWLGGAVVAALLLVTQVVHQNHEWFFGTSPFGSSLRALSSSLGAAVASPATLSAYQLRQWGVTGDPAANGTLRVRASILNTAAQLQPYPLLRVTLANRFGSRIGARDFEPTEYLGKPTARLLAPGERADATLDILDPGKSAEGFEIDVCLRQADKKIACASDVAPQTKK